MSRSVKELLRKDLQARFKGLNSLALVGFSGLDAVQTNEIRGRLRGKNISMTVVKNSIARQAFRAIGLDVAAELIDGPCAVTYGGDSLILVIRELLEIGKEAPGLTVKAAVLDGEGFGPDRIEELGKFPTREEALATIVSCALSPGRKLAACLIGPGARVASILKTIQDKQGGEVTEAA